MIVFRHIDAGGVMPNSVYYCRTNRVAELSDRIGRFTDAIAEAMHLIVSGQAAAVINKVIAARWPGKDPDLLRRAAEEMARGRLWDSAVIDRDASDRWMRDPGRRRSRGPGPDSGTAHRGTPGGRGIVTLILGAHDIEALLTGIDVIAEMEAVHADLGTGEMDQPAPASLHGNTGDSVFLPMAARSDRLGLVVTKTLADIPANAARGLPTQRSTLLVTSAVTGECVAVLDGAAITRHRTAATSAVATRHLAAPGSQVLGLIGAGNLAVQHARMLPTVAPLHEIVVWSRSAATLDAFLDAIGPDMARRTTIARDPGSVVATADIVCTLTPSRSPIVRGAWLRPGQHVNAVGARPRPTHRELDSAAMARATLIVDSAPTALAKSGDLLEAIAEGALPSGQPLTELGTVVAGRAPGRTRADEITVFDSVGLAAQDLALAAAIIRRARTTGAGEELKLTSVIAPGEVP